MDNSVPTVQGTPKNIHHLAFDYWGFTSRIINFEKDTEYYGELYFLNCSRPFFVSNHKRLFFRSQFKCIGRRSK